MRIASVLLGTISLIATNLLVGWSAYHWKDAIVRRSLDSITERAATSDRENRELQDIVAELRQKSNNFMVQLTDAGQGETRVTVQRANERGGSFSLRTPASWDTVGVTSVEYAPNGETIKITQGWLLTPKYQENVDLPYDPSVMIWAVDPKYKDDGGVRAVVGDYITSSPTNAYFAHARINGRRDCKNNDRLCREALQKITTEAQQVLSTFVVLNP